jgi:hypothetical protein
VIANAKYILETKSVVRTSKDLVLLLCIAPRLGKNPFICNLLVILNFSFSD